MFFSEIGLNAFPDWIISSVEGAEDGVARFTSFVRAIGTNFQYHESWWMNIIGRVTRKKIYVLCPCRLCWLCSQDCSQREVTGDVRCELTYLTTKHRVISCVLCHGDGSGGVLWFQVGHPSVCPSERPSVFRFRLITWVNINGLSPNLVCALILWRSGLGLLMGKFRQILTDLPKTHPYFRFRAITWVHVKGF